MNLVFDTSIIIDLERGRRETIVKINELRKLYPAPARISFISYFEFLYGLKEKSPKNQEKSRAFIDKFRVLQTSKKTAEILANLKKLYELSLSDLIIAAQVIENNYILVTKDKDFEKINEIERIIVKY